MKSRALFLLGGLAALAASGFRDAGSHPVLARVATGPLSHIASSLANDRDLTSSHAKRATPTPKRNLGPYAAGLADLQARKYAAAETAFRQAIAKHDHVFASYVGLATAASDRHDYGTAYQAYRHAALMQPKNGSLQYQTAFSALYAEDYHAAVQFATRYIALRPKDWRGYHLRFLAYGDLLDRKHQVTDAAQVAKLQPHSASALNDLGIALANDGKYARSEKELTAAIKLDPTNPIYYSNRGQAEYQEKKLQAALRDFEKARALTKDKLRRKQLDAAIAYLRKQIHH
jgi:Flp pilus assembly protein TadD